MAASIRLIGIVISIFAFGFTMAAAMFVRPGSTIPTIASIQPALTDTFELVGQVGGAIKAFDVQGAYAYAAIGPRLVVLDITNPTQPALHGQSDLLSVDIQDIIVQGDYVYAAAGRDGLIILTASPTRPVVVAKLPIVESVGWLAVADTHVFLPTIVAGIVIVDVAQPTTPAVVAMYPAPFLQDMTINGTTMYLARGDVLSIVDITDPIHPTLITDYNVSVRQIEVDGNLAYIGSLEQINITDYAGTLRILDISDAKNIVERFYSSSNYFNPVFGQLYDMKLLNHQLYAHSYNCTEGNGCGMHFGSIDVSNPMNPSSARTLLYSAKQGAILTDSAVAGKYVYMAIDGVLHIFASESQVEQGQYRSWLPSTVRVAQGVAYVGAKGGELRAIDVTTPEQPTVLDTYIATIGIQALQPAFIADIAIYGSYIYASLSTSGRYVEGTDILTIVNTRDIQHVATTDPFLVPTVMHNGYAYSVGTTPTGSRLKRIDMSDPAHPSLCAEIQTTTTPSDFTISGNYAYVSGASQGLDIINIADPRALVEIQRLDATTVAFLVDSTDAALYTLSSQTLNSYDLHNPATPVKTNSTPVSPMRPDQEPMDMQVRNGYIYWAETNSDAAPNTTLLHLFHVTDVHAPVQEVTSFTLPGSRFLSIDVVGDMVYIASPEDGLLVLRHHRNAPPLQQQAFLPLVASASTTLTARCTSGK